MSKRLRNTELCADCSAPGKGTPAPAAVFTVSPNPATFANPQCCTYFESVFCGCELIKQGQGVWLFEKQKKVAVVFKTIQVSCYPISNNGFY